MARRKKKDWSKRTRPLSREEYRYRIMRGEEIPRAACAANLAYGDVRRPAGRTAGGLHAGGLANDNGEREVDGG